MPQTATLTAKQSLAAQTQVLRLRRVKGVQGPRNGGLICKRIPAPGCGQNPVGPQPRVDVGNGSAPRQHTNQGIQQLVLGPMVNRFHVERQLLPKDVQKVAVRETIAQRA